MKTVTVHQFRKWDINAGQYDHPPWKSTAEKIEEAGGEIIPETAEQVPIAKLDGLGRYNPDQREE
jgi:hypothetical protein